MPRATAKTRQKVTCYIAPDVVSMADSHIENACLENRSDIIEEALKYYCAYLDADKNHSVFDRELSEMIRSIVRESEGKLNSHLRSMDISISMFANLFAANLVNMTDDEIALLRRNAVRFVDDNHRAKSFVIAQREEKEALDGASEKQ